MTPDEMQREVERLQGERDARGDIIGALTREVADLRCILRAVRDAAEPGTVVHDLACLGLLQ